jgi:signal transduction histidine kinase
MGTIGGLWLSAQFLGRIDLMRQTARRLMDGDWSRRIPLSRTDDDLTALARTFNRLFDRIEKLLQANKQVSADIAHDLRKPLAGGLRRLEVARDDLSSGAGRDAIGEAIGDVEGVLDTFNALLRIGQIEAGARRSGRSTLPKWRARLLRRSRRPLKTKGRRWSRTSTSCSRSPATRNSGCR